MNIIRPVIGIPNYDWKKKVIKFARENPFILKVKVKDLCFECNRHKELLEMFDAGDTNYKNSNYFKYSIKNSGKTQKVALKKIDRFKDMYLKIKAGDYSYYIKKMPIITEDGCRLDGSHRMVISEHIGIINIKVNIFVYSKLFSLKILNKILNDNKEYRRKVYHL